MAKENNKADNDVQMETNDQDNEIKMASAALLKNPAVMAALQGKLDGMVGSPSGYVQVIGTLIKLPLGSSIAWHGIKASL